MVCRRACAALSFLAAGELLRHSGGRMHAFRGLLATWMAEVDRVHIMHVRRGACRAHLKGAEAFLEELGAQLRGGLLQKCGSG